MIGRDDYLRISQSALSKAGRFGLARALNREEKENLSGLLKFMVERSAMAGGRTRNKQRSTANRRRYGDFILVLKGDVLVDVALTKRDWCVQCLGVKRGHSCSCN